MPPSSARRAANFSALLCTCFALILAVENPGPAAAQIPGNPETRPIREEAELEKKQERAVTLDLDATRPKGASEPASTADGKLRESRAALWRKIIQSCVILAIGYLCIFVLALLVNRQIKDLKVRHLVRKNISYLVNILVLLYVFFLWAQNIGSLTIFLGVAGAGVALALQEVILCIAGWFFILLRRPFEVGDRVELGGVKGDVIDIRLFQTSLLEIGNWVGSDQSTGRIANIPNSAMFKRENYNYSRGFEYIWNEIRILVTFESDWKRAEEIMLAHARSRVMVTEERVKRKIAAMARRYMIHYDRLTPIVYADIKDSGIELTLRYLTEAKQRRSTQDALCRAILDDFKREERVNFAYTTYRIVR